MKPIIIKVEGINYLSWNEKLYKLKILSGKYRHKYGDIDYLLEHEDDFSYDIFKQFKGTDLPDNFCVTSYCKVAQYPPAFTLKVVRSGLNMTFCLVNCYHLSEWKNDYHLGKFCERLWKAFAIAGHKTDVKPELEESSYFIPVSMTVPAGNVIQEVIENSCNRLNEVHNSLLRQIINKGTDIDLASPVTFKDKMSDDGENIKIVEGLEITKYKGKFFEIDIPKIAKKIIKRIKA